VREALKNISTQFNVSGHVVRNILFISCPGNIGRRFLCENYLEFLPENLILSGNLFRSILFIFSPGIDGMGFCAKISEN